MSDYIYGDLQSVEFEGKNADKQATEWQKAMTNSDLVIELTDSAEMGSDNSKLVTLYYYILTPQEKQCNESDKTIQEMLSVHYNKQNTNKVEKHKEICDKLNKVYADKNSDYGDSFAISYYLFGMTGVLQRLFDKWIRVYMLQYKSQKVNDESIVDSLRDLTNYSIMTLIELENDNTNDPAKRLAEALKELAGIEVE